MDAAICDLDILRTAKRSVLYVFACLGLQTKLDAVEHLEEFFVRTRQLEGDGCGDALVVARLDVNAGNGDAFDVVALFVEGMHTQVEGEGDGREYVGLYFEGNAFVFEIIEIDVDGF